jgi:hypothetical protein
VGRPWDDTKNAKLFKDQIQSFYLEPELVNEDVLFDIDVTFFLFCLRESHCSPYKAEGTCLFKDDAP